MFPPEISVKPYWCLYDTMSGQTILKYPWREGQEVPCPHCGNRLLFKNYVANCCGEAFRSGSGEIHQNAPLQLTPNVLAAAGQASVRTRQRTATGVRIKKGWIKDEERDEET